MKAILDFVTARLKEPSTYAAIAPMAVALGLAPDLFQSIWGVVAAAAALLGVVLAEKASS